MKKQNVAKKNIILLIIILVIGVFPLVMIKGSDFGGADDKAEELIQEINPTYEPWAKNIIELPGGETESLLFALQAALGAGVIGYVLGYLRGERKNANR